MAPDCWPGSKATPTLLRLCRRKPWHWHANSATRLQSASRSTAWVNTARLRGDYPTARALLEDALRVGRDAGSRTVEAWSVGALGVVADAEGDDAAARDLGVLALELFGAVGSERG